MHRHSWKTGPQGWFGAHYRRQAGVPSAEFIEATAKAFEIVNDCLPVVSAGPCMALSGCSIDLATQCSAGDVEIQEIVIVSSIWRKPMACERDRTPLPAHTRQYVCVSRRTRDLLEDCLDASQTPIGCATAQEIDPRKAFGGSRGLWQYFFQLNEIRWTNGPQSRSRHSKGSQTGELPLMSCAGKGA